MLKIAEYRKVLSEDGKSVRIEKINLNELEKFGFKYNKNINCYVRDGRNEYVDEQATYYVTEERELQINTYNGDYTLDDVIYDLIEAGIVEKVVES